jgi:hypothetical protein
VAKIVHQCLADIHRQRQPVATATFAVDAQCSGFPVDVVEQQSRRLGAPQSQTLQTDDHRVVTATNRCAAVARIQ